MPTYEYSSNIRVRVLSQERPWLDRQVPDERYTDTPQQESLTSTISPTSTRPSLNFQCLAPLFLKLFAPLRATRRGALPQSLVL